MHKAGFVNIVGNPNVGKSTLMNSLVGERISIITSKAQTTRHRIMGIVNTDDIQIVYSDTPGVLSPHYKLQESMLNFSQSALTDADILLYVTDVVETPDKNPEFLERVSKETIPVILLIDRRHDRLLHVLQPLDVVPLRRLRADDPDRRLHRLQEPRQAHQRPGGPERTDQVVDLAAGLLPDFQRRILVVRQVVEPE